MAVNRKKERAVVVTTAHKGVFFGYTTDTTKDVINLRSGRMCIYWSEDLRGVVGLATVGPNNKCKVGPSADMEIRNITAVFLATDTAVAAWEKAPWA